MRARSRASAPTSFACLAVIIRLEESQCHRFEAYVFLESNRDFLPEVAWSVNPVPINGWLLIEQKSSCSLAWLKGVACLVRRLPCSSNVEANQQTSWVWVSASILFYGGKLLAFNSRLGCENRIWRIFLRGQCQLWLRRNFVGGITVSRVNSNPHRELVHKAAF